MCQDNKNVAKSELLQGTRSDRVQNELWMEVHEIIQETEIKTFPQKKKCKKAKWLPEEALQIAEKRSKRQRRKGNIHPFECKVPKNSNER